MPEPGLRLEDPVPVTPAPGSGNGHGAPAESAERRLTTVFWDTGDLRLARWGGSLRHRSDEGWTLALPPLPGATPPPGDASGELHFPGDGQAPPAAALDLLVAFSRGAELEAVARVRTRGAAFGLGPRSDAPADVVVAAVDGDASAGAVLQAAVAGSVARLLLHDPRVRLAPDPEAVHQARVATRRLRSDLRTFGALVDPGWTADLRERLSRLADLLGEVRDADIMSARLTVRAREVGLAGGRARGLSTRLSGQRRSARARLLAAMRGEEYLALLQDLVAAAREPRLQPLAEAPAAEVMVPMAARTWSRLEKAVKRLGKAPSDTELHAVRIAAKRARYAVEVLVPVAGRRARRMADAIGELQTTLGEYNDAVVTVAWLRQAAEGVDAATAFIAGALTERERGTADARRGAWPAAWKKLSKKKLRGWLEP
ncbi:MAG: hypothetical protein QOE92_1801 [Chloroflexota bacterium]|nr:hypothetical protein [Chloroflexota bacterium]